jgi:Leucine-rich repeat (LRR) protein
MRWACNGRDRTIISISPLASLTNLIHVHFNRNPLNQEAEDIHVPSLISIDRMHGVMHP